MFNRLFWARLGRDLRKRWVQVGIISVILGIGTGAFWGLFSGVQWRIDGVNHYFAESYLDDGIISFAQDHEVNYSEIIKTMADFPRLNELQSWDLRLKIPLAYEFNTTEGFTVIKGYLYGLEEKSFNTTEVDKLILYKGRFLTNNDSNKSYILLDTNFCRTYNLKLNDHLNLRFPKSILNVELEGMVNSPEWLMIFDPDSTSFSASVQFGIGYTLLSELQVWSGLKDSINELIFTIKESNIDNLLGQSLREFLKEKGFECSYNSRKDSPLIGILEEQDKNDLELVTAISLLIVFVALFALWISINRMITQQRRDIGIELSLGITERSILLYYLFYGLIISFLGIFIGIIIGNFIAEEAINLFLGYMVIPNLEKPILWDRLIQAIVICSICSLFASFWPARNAAKMIPINALRQDPSLGGATYKNPKLYEKVFTKIFNISLTSRIAARNIFRNRKRTFATIFGIAFSLALVIAYLGAFDSFIFLKNNYTDDLGDWDVRVSFNTPKLYSTNVIPFINDSRIAQINYGIVHFAEIQKEGKTRLIELKGYNGNLIPEKISNGIMNQSMTNNIAISKALASELRITLGDTVNLTHLFYGSNSTTIKQTSQKVDYWHERVSKLEVIVPWQGIQTMFNLTGSTNQLLIKLTSEADISDFREFLFSFSFVRIVELHEDPIRDLDEVLNTFRGLMQIIEGLTMLLCFGIILLTAMINNSEREREHGTMMTLGGSDMSILKISLWEVTFLSIIGILVGQLFGQIVLGAILMPAFQAAYNVYIIKTKIQFSTILVFSGITVAIALISQLSILFNFRKMELSKATKVRDF